MSNQIINGNQRPISHLMPNATYVGADSCGNCKFFQQINPQSGLCRRYPPAIQIIPVAGGMAPAVNLYPVVPEEAWCGEWATRIGVLS
jgi:hypothetical protein